MQLQNYITNKYVRPCNTQIEMYAGHVKCCFLVSHIEYVPMGQMDARLLHHAYL